MLRKVTDVMDAARRQQVEVFDGGVWSGGAANAANGALGTNLTELSTLQDYLATVITWHRHIAGLIAAAKAEIGNNVDGAQREISILEHDPELQAEARVAAINAVVRATHEANSSLVAETAEQVLASKDWRPPHNALQDLLHQVMPPAPDGRPWWFRRLACPARSPRCPLRSSRHRPIPTSRSGRALRCRR